MQGDIANFLSKGCITAAPFEQTTEDAVEHHFGNPHLFELIVYTKENY
jgi:hypothetical protein